MDTETEQQGSRKACIVRLPVATHRALRKVAFQQETSMQRLMADAIARWVRELQQQEQQDRDAAA